MINAYLTKPINWISQGAPDDWNEPGPEIKTAMKARVNFETQIIRDQNGQLTESKVNILVKANFNPGYNDRFQIDGIRYAILKIANMEDFSIRFKQIWLS